MKPKRIFEILKEKGFNPRDVVQIRNYLHAFKKTLYGPSAISLGELEAWCIDNSSVPVDEDTAFVFAHSVTYDDDELTGEPSFRLSISTPRLLSQSESTTHLHADATYKLNWEGMPVLVVGTTDKDRHFVPISIAVCSDEQTSSFEFIFAALKAFSNYAPLHLVSDASLAIRNAFVDVFGSESKLIMCWAHTRRNIVKSLHLASMTNDYDARDDLMTDIDLLQLSQNEEAFNKGVLMFHKKWSKSQKEFVDYLEQIWFSTHPGWYEGFADGIPSTNNALESFNSVIKKEETLRERMPLSQYLPLCLASAQRWSKQYESKTIATVPTITLADWTQAYHWAKSDKVVPAKNVSGGLVQYFCPAADKTTLTSQDIQRFSEQNWNTLDQLKRRSQILSMVSMPIGDWKAAKCTCRSFLKTGKCKHVIGIAIRQKQVKPPPAAKQIPIGQKPKRGRPKLATKALLMD